MKSKWTLCLLLTAAPLCAQEYSDLVDWMKSTNAAMGELRKMEKKTGPHATAQAERVGGIYEKMMQFWRERGAQDAVKISQDGKAAAVELASAANGGNAESAEAALKTLGATCGACHTAHRTKGPDGKYQIK